MVVGRLYTGVNGFRILLVQASSTNTPSLLSSTCAPGAHSLSRRCYSLCTLRTPRAFTRSECSWVRTTCTADDAAGAISARLEPLRDPRGPSTHYLCHRCCHLCTLRTPRAYIRPAWFWRALPVSPMLQLVHSPHASKKHSHEYLVSTFSTE